MIDDDMDDIHLVEEAFSQINKDIVFDYQTHGENVIEYLSNLPDHPDIILLDLNMPKKNGKEVLKEIKSNSRFADIPVVIFTTSISESDRKECFQLKANSVVSKPALFNYWQILLESLCAIFLRSCASIQNKNSIDQQGKSMKPNNAPDTQK